MNYSIVTGASKGIGKAIAVELAKNNLNLLLVDMDELGLFKAAQDIKKQHDVNVETFTLDLSVGDVADKLFHLTKRYHDHLTVVVNSAGYDLNGSLAGIPLPQHMANRDVKSVVGISRRFIPVLNKQEKGYLLNVAGTTAYQTAPCLYSFASTQAFVLSFTRILKYELRNTNVSVSVLSPVITDTDFVHRVTMGESVLKAVKKLNMSAETVAEIAIEGMFKRHAEIVPGLTSKLNAFLPKFFPKSFAEKYAGKIYELKQSPEGAALFK